MAYKLLEMMQWIQILTIMSEQPQIELTPSTDVGPQTPLPQTVTGILQDKGLPFSTPDGLPYLHFETSDTLDRKELWSPNFDFKVSDSDVVGKLYQTLHLPSIFPDLDAAGQGILPPMAFNALAYRYFNGSIKISFWAVKPPGMPCKLIVSYVPPGGTFNASYRHVSREWDWSKSNIFSITVTGFNPYSHYMQQPMTFIKQGTETGTTLDGIATDPFMRSFGTMKIELAAIMQSGTIYPKDIQVHTFVSLVESEHHIVKGLPTDFNATIFFQGAYNYFCTK